LRVNVTLPRLQQFFKQLLTCRHIIWCTCKIFVYYTTLKSTQYCLKDV